VTPKRWDDPKSSAGDVLVAPSGGIALKSPQAADLQREPVAGLLVRAQSVSRIAATSAQLKN
jgi:hypothetical protein